VDGQGLEYGRSATLAAMGVHPAQLRVQDIGSNECRRAT